MTGRRLAVASAAFALGVLLSGCTASKIAGGVTGSLFSAPRPVKKAKRPVLPDARLAVVWVGHATALIQIGDKVILTDPVFTSSVGQLSVRLFEPGIDPKDFPKIDAVLVSHGHYDHLSLGSLSQIEEKVGTLLLPPGGASYLTDFSFAAVELRPYQAWQKDGLRVTAVPVAHVGARYGFDRWMAGAYTGYVIEYDGLKVYFGGDTAYDAQLFADTAAHFPGIDLAFLPIAPIEPRGFMRRTHEDPYEAVQAFSDLGARTMVPIHYDTFVNSADAPGDALRELAKAKARYGLEGREITPLAIGERRVFIKRGEQAPQRSAPPPASSKTPPEKKSPEKKSPEDSSDIPDDQRLD